MVDEKGIEKLPQITRIELIHCDSGEIFSYKSYIIGSGLDFFSLVEELAQLIITIQSRRKFSQPSKRLHISIIGFDSNDVFFKKTSSNFLSLKQDPYSVYSYFGTELFTLLNFNLSTSFFEYLLLKEAAFYNKKKSVLPHARLYFPSNYQKLGINLDIEDLKRFDKLTIDSQERIWHKKNDTDYFLKRLETQLIKTSHGEIFNFLFGNYPELKNIYACTRIYALGQHLLNCNLKKDNEQ